MVEYVLAIMLQQKGDANYAIIRSPNQKLVWVQNDYPSVKRFELVIDDSTVVDLGKSSIRIGNRVESSIPSMSRGRHVLKLRACNEGGCSKESNELRVLYRLGAK